MKIALSFPGCHRRGGVERVVFECAKHLAARGHQLDIFAEEWEPIAAQNVHFHEVRVQKRPRFLEGQRYFKAATSMLGESRHDVLNTHGCVCPTGGVHWVQSVHIAWLERAKQMRHPMSSARLKQLLNPVHRIILGLEAVHFRERAYRKVIATTSRVADDLRRFYGVPGEDVVIVPNGFNPVEFNPQRRADRREGVRTRLGLSPDHIAFLFVANELQRKGYEVVLKAMRALDDPRMRLVVIGRPPVSEVMKLAEMEGVHQQVIALGPSSDVAEMHAAADLFVLPTQYEAFSLAILESLGSGLPVVTTEVPGARDAIQPGVNGYLMKDPLSDQELVSILRPILDHDVIARLAATTSSTVEQYKWPNVLKRYEEVLNTYAKAH